jgi:uncharacterized membrane protein
MTLPNSEPSAPVTGWRRSLVIWIDKGVLAFARHWVLYIALAAAVYGGIPFLAPVAMHFGQTGVANVIYSVYSPVCHQFAFRSWFLFGEQPAYPRALAGVPGQTFEQVASADPTFNGIDVTTLTTPLIFAAKAFRGNDQMGWKVAFCERDVAIYLVIGLAGFAYAIIRRMKIKIPYLPFWAYILIAIVPIGLDGFSQLFANPPFNGFGLSFYPIRESTPFLRTLTGALFGLGNAWLVFPYIDDSMVETREIVETKLVNAGVLQPSSVRQPEGGPTYTGPDSAKK